MLYLMVVVFRLKDIYFSLGLVGRILDFCM